MVKIPRFRTEEEMREFLDTHDSSKYFEDMAVIYLGQRRRRAVYGKSVRTVR